MRIVWNLGLAAMVFGMCGCAEWRDIPKTIWGSSTRVLEEARANALTKTYDKGYWDCYNTALNVVRKKKYVLFKKDEVRGYMVIMGIPGSVNTTEVGVFFVELNDHQTRIELSSLSTNAKRLLSMGLFHGMDIAFGLAAPDKQEGFAAMEFQNGLKPEALVKAIDNDGFSISSDQDPVDALNEFLENPKYYEDWNYKYRGSIVLPKEALDLIVLKDKSMDQIKHLNRLILEATYPSVCPKVEPTTGTVSQ